MIHRNEVIYDSTYLSSETKPKGNIRLDQIIADRSKRYGGFCKRNGLFWPANLRGI